MSASKGKGKKKKWSKGKVKEKKDHVCVIESETALERICRDAPKKMPAMTVAAIIEQFKVNGSVARRVIREMQNRGIVRCVDRNASMGIYTAVE